MSAIESLPLFAWAKAQPPSTASIVSLAEFRSTSARWRMETEPRSESVEAAVLALARTLKMAPSAPVFSFPEIRPLRRA